jgi:large repetitive protein
MAHLLKWSARWFAWGASLVTCQAASPEGFSWAASGPSLAMTRVTNPGPVICTAVRVELDRFNTDLALTTTLASNTVVGLEPLGRQISALPKDLGTPVAAMNGDFFAMTGPARGDPRGLHILGGELVSVPAGPAAFWLDAKATLHGEPVASRLQVLWPDGGINLSGLNEPLGTNTMVLYTPRMGVLCKESPQTNSRSFISTRPNAIRRPQVMRPPGGREWTLEYAGSGPWLPLRVGQTYQAKVTGSSDGFTNVLPGTMLMSLGPNLVANLPAITNGTSVTIRVATEPDLSGVQTAIGSGPMLVRDGRRQEVTARTSEQLHPRSALGWNDQYLYLAVADGRQKGISTGLRLSEMADFLIELGCQQAITMDGGPSTRLILNGTTINHPIQGRDRDIANAIVVLRKSAAAEDPDE